ncbi:MAG: hypothetical protein NC453_21730 [Muribaculum sp.]|nr:hypothetical protein [Muribaculum sp.]
MIDYDLLTDLSGFDGFSEYDHISIFLGTVYRLGEISYDLDLSSRRQGTTSTDRSETYRALQKARCYYGSYLTNGQLLHNTLCLL